MSGAPLRLPCLALLAALAAPAHAQVASRLVDQVEVTQAKEYATVTIVFGCEVRYLSHAPASSGEAVRIRLVPGIDCGAPAAGWVVPPPLDDRGVIQAINVVRTVGRDADLTIRWSKGEQFVLVPATNGRGLRILLSRASQKQASVTVREVTGGATAYAVNLDVSQEPYNAAALAAAQQATGVPVYVSETVLDGHKWYRLRAGPFVSESDAKQVLANARTRYPKAWLAVADDARLTETGLPDAIGSVQAASAPADVTMSPQDIERTMKRAQEMMRRKDYVVAIQLLTSLTEQPEYPGRAEAVELLGLARERNGQLAHAKAEYEEYLRRYPDGAGAERVSKRLRAITFESSPAAMQARAAAANQPRWKVYGGVSQTYQRDMTSFDNGTVSSNATTQDAVLTDVALATRRTGERYDFTARTSGTYGLDLLADGPGNQGTLNLLYAELRDRTLDWTLRGGRQSGSLGGLIGTFDGIYGAYQVLPQMRLDAYYGYPVYSTRASPSTDRNFYAVAADFGTFAETWDVTVYALQQMYSGLTDREAVGTELRYFRPGLTVIGLVDYDIHFGDVNDALLLVNAALPADWTLSLNLDHRKSPGLSVGNALMGQSLTSFDQLFDSYSAAQIEQLAVDRTADSDTYTVSLQRMFGDRWQWSMDVSSVTIGATPASGGVDATPASGTDMIYSSQAVAYGLFGDRDVDSLGLQYQTGDASDTMSLGLFAQLPVGESWLITPRLRIDRRQFHADGSTQLLYAPGLRTEWRWRRLSLDFEGGAEIGQRSGGIANEDTTRYYFSLGYRYDM